MSRVFLVDFYFQKENKDLFRQLVGQFCNNSPFLHYPLVPSFKKINIGNTGNQNPPEGGFWLPVFPILIFVSR